MLKYDSSSRQIRATIAVLCGVAGILVMLALFVAVGGTKTVPRSRHPVAAAHKRFGQVVPPSGEEVNPSGYWPGRLRTIAYITYDRKGIAYAWRPLRPGIHVGREVLVYAPKVGAAYIPADLTRPRLNPYAVHTERLREFRWSSFGICALFGLAVSILGYASLVFACRHNQPDSPRRAPA